MIISIIVFAVLAAVAVGSAVMMLAAKNPVRSALYLVVTFVCLAGLYLALSAPLLAMVQILVYAGAIMVLFLFVLMFFFEPGVEVNQRSVLRGQHAAAAVLVVILFFLVFFALSSFSIPSFANRPRERAAAGRLSAVRGPQARSFQGASPFDVRVNPLANRTEGVQDETHNPLFVGRAMFSSNLLAFELTSLLLLAAIIGVVVLVRQDKGEQGALIDEEADE
jgi:NADH-quinone oxidoreductase subunit J